MFMNILWICNKVPAPIAEIMEMVTSPLGGWLDVMVIELVNQGYHLTVVCPYHTTCNKADGLLSFYSFEDNACESVIRQRIKEIMILENPDVIHIWGTEFKHTYYSLDIAENMGLIDRCVVSIQGLVSIIGKYHFDVGIPAYVKYGMSFHDLIRQSNVFFQKRDFQKRGTFEINAIKKAKNIIGRTEWDKAVTELINPSAQYHVCNETLRSVFYFGKWDVSNIERHSVFVSQCSYPIKGFHYVIQALPYILKEFPDTVVYTTGYNLVNLNIHEKCEFHIIKYI